MKKVWAFLVVIVGSCIQFSCDKNEDSIPEFPIEQADAISIDEYQIYSHVLERFSSSQLVVRQKTSAYTPSEEKLTLFFNLEKLAAMDEGLYNQFQLENSATYLLGPDIVVPGKETYLLSNDAYSYYFDRANHSISWELFDKKYPNGGKWYTTFTKIGFNESINQALVGMESYWYMSSENGSTHKSGTLFYLEKIDGVWTFIASTAYELP